MWEDVIHLGSGHSLIMGYLPPGKLKLAQVINKIKDHSQQDITRLGLFDASSPNYTTFYPDVTPEDFVPKDEEFIYAPFRALSEVVVHKEWNPVDFGVGNILKPSMSLLLGTTINPDHESRVVGNALGAVNEVEWEEAYKTKDVKVPAGVNAIFKIDAKSNPRIARGIMMDPPSIHSNSVTVRFLWDKSHPQLTEEEFWNKLGTYDKEGQMIRRIATKIKNYPETSLVHHGADPFAQKQGKDGKIVNPRYADTVYNSEQMVDVRYSRKNEKYFLFDFKLDLIANSENTTIPAQSKNNENLNLSQMNEILLAFAAALGMTGDTHTKETILAALTAKTNSVTTLQAALDAAKLAQPNEAEVIRLKGLETELGTFKALNLTVEGITALAAFQTKTLTDRRAAVTALYNKVMDNKPEAGIVSMISQANTLEALDALAVQYEQQLDTKFPSKCGKCGSTNITKASAAPAKPTEGSHVELSTEEAIQQIAAAKRKSGNLALNAEPVKK